MSSRTRPSPRRHRPQLLEEWGADTNELRAIMSTPKLVEQFYTRIWNAGDLNAVSDLLAADFAFRGSLGTELSGHNAFKEYVLSVRDS